MPSFDLTDRTALVTGGSRGIGLAIGAALAGAGARVVLAARHADAVEQAAAQLRESGAQVIGVAANVGKADDAQMLVEATTAAFGPVDVLVNNAATSLPFGPHRDAARAQRRSGGARRGGALPGFARLRLHHGPGAGGGRRDDARLLRRAGVRGYGETRSRTEFSGVARRQRRAELTAEARRAEEVL